jgi:glycerophosphoryl diester phosphodiesterase
MLFKTNTVVGHRGCRDFDQNNTAEAFEKAIADGAEMVEMDVRRTRDDVLVVWHDRTVGTQRIRGSNYEDLVALANQEGKVLPTLEDILRRLEGRVQLMVELKEAGYEEQAVGLLLKYFSPSEMVITSFLDQAILTVKERFPTVKTGLILGVGPGNGEFNWRGLGRFTQRLSEFFPWVRMKACRADCLAVSKNILFLGLAKNAFKKHVPIFVWTVDQAAQIRRLMKSRYFNGIISNRPGLAVEIRNNL